MRIERLELENFRLFEKASFNFPAMFTVLIGENGRGKSALLHGLRVAAGAWLEGFREVADQAGIEQEDVRRVEQDHSFRPQFPTRVEAVGIVEHQRISWASQRKDFRSSIRRTVVPTAKKLIALAEQLDVATNDKLEDVPLPVLVFFSTARLRVGAKKNVELKSKGFKIQEGYFQALLPDYKRKPPSGRTVAFNWIRDAYYRKLEGDIDFLQAVAISLGKAVAPGPQDVPQLDAVLEAIETCVPGWKELRWGLEDKDLMGIYTRPDGSTERVPLYYLSDGLRTMAGMVAEIAYRCVRLNGHLGREAVKRSKGLVLIDELDMHLHPNWQRHVVADLKKAFPNLQFVVTTHSPFIVQSLDSTELINLDEWQADEMEFPSDVAPKNLRLEEVATEVMKVESPLSEASEDKEQMVEQYLKLLQEPETLNGELAQATVAQLKSLESSIADPGLLAILRLHRLAKEAHS